MTDRPNTEHLASLGSQGTEYTYEGADASLLETFENPMPRGSVNSWITITAPEFTSLCPKTGQPDFATIIVKYRPRELCVESKSWKLYLGSYRNAKDFHETCVTRIFEDLVMLLEPEELIVEGQFTPRGGIPFWPHIHYVRPGNAEQLTLFKPLGAGFV